MQISQKTESWVLAMVTLSDNTQTKFQELKNLIMAIATAVAFNF